MSTYATTDGATVSFDTYEHTKEAFVAFHAFRLDANAGKFNGDFCIDGNVMLDHRMGMIDFKASSSRAQNLDWQLAQILAFFKAQPGMVEFNAPVLVATDGVYWRVGDEKEAASQS
jgi:hypothetical protein